MSLVSEALRKARREAADRKRPSRLPGALPEPPGGGRGTRFGAGLLLGASIALAAALLGAAATWWLVATLRSGPADSGALPTPVEARLAEEGVVPATPKAPVPTGAAVGAPLPTAAPAAPPKAHPGATDAGTAPVGDAAPAPSPSPRATPQGSDGGAGPPLRATAAAGGERVYVLEADLGYASLSLGFVVARPNDPFAEINGREVHVGSELEGFVVEEISTRGVRLRDARGPLELRLR